MKRNHYRVWRNGRTGRWNAQPQAAQGLLMPFKVLANWSTTITIACLKNWLKASSPATSVAANAFLSIIIASNGDRKTLFWWYQARGCLLTEPDWFPMPVLFHQTIKQKMAAEHNAEQTKCFITKMVLCWSVLSTIANTHVKAQYPRTTAFIVLGEHSSFYRQESRK